MMTLSRILLDPHFIALNLWLYGNKKHKNRNLMSLSSNSLCDDTIYISHNQETSWWSIHCSGFIAVVRSLELRFQVILYLIFYAMTRDLYRRAYGSFFLECSAWLFCALNINYILISNELFKDTIYTVRASGETILADVLLNDGNRQQKGSYTPRQTSKESSSMYGDEADGCKEKAFHKRTNHTRSITWLLSSKRIGTNLVNNSTYRSPARRDPSPQPHRSQSRHTVKHSIAYLACWSIPGEVPRAAVGHWLKDRMYLSSFSAIVFSSMSSFEAYIRWQRAKAWRAGRICNIFRPLRLWLWRSIAEWLYLRNTMAVLLATLGEIVKLEWI